MSAVELFYTKVRGKEGTHTIVAEKRRTRGESKKKKRTKKMKMGQVKGMHVRG